MSCPTPSFKVQEKAGAKGGETAAFHRPFDKGIYCHELARRVMEIAMQSFDVDRLALLDLISTWVAMVFR
jgi:hypothetical protein